MNAPEPTTKARDLACRYLALWEEYLTALITDPVGADAPEPQGNSVPDRAGSSNDTNRKPGPTARAASVSGSSGECGQLMADLTRRLADLEQRVAAAERVQRAAKRARRRDRRVRA